MEDKRSKFKGYNSLLFKPLLLEFTRDDDKSRVLYTLQPEDNEYPSLRRLYLEERDLSEYTFAMKYFYNYTHWERLCNMEWFKPYVESWRRELEAYYQSLALSRLTELATLPNPQQANALKYLLEGKWKRKEPVRKSKVVVTPTVNKPKTIEHLDLDEHYERLFASSPPEKAS